MRSKYQKGKKTNLPWERTSGNGLGFEALLPKHSSMSQWRKALDEELGTYLKQKLRWFKFYSPQYVLPSLIAWHPPDHERRDVPDCLDFF